MTKDIEQTMILTQEQLRTAQHIMLFILKRIDEVCKKHDIKYWLEFGTMLGAVRHCGFIPWDDDLDIGMFRKDFEKFSKVAPKEFGDTFFWQTMQTDPTYPYVFGKIRLNGTLWIEPGKKDCSEDHNGIWVDIFPVDPVPPNRFIRAGYFRVLRWINSLMIHSRYAMPSGNKFVSKMFLLAQKIIPFQALSKTYYHLLQRLNKVYSERTELVTTYDWSGAIMNLSRRCVYEKVVLHTFEDQMFPIPEGYDERLTRRYGDYMTPPPLEKQTGKHRLEIVDFGEYSKV